MPGRERGPSTGSGGQPSCVICLGPPKVPTGRPDTCDHVFCYLCINNWLKRRSECPLCKRKAKFIIKTTANGNVTKVKVKERTAAHFSNELANDDEARGNVREVDITVAYASCRVCHQSDNEDQLLLCDGTVGQEFDGTPIRCNAAYHCYCLPEPLANVPRGRWYCPYCTDLLETQRGVYNRRYVTPVRNRGPVPVIDLVDSDENLPGPSRRPAPRRRVIVIDGDDESFSEEVSSSEESDSEIESVEPLGDEEEEPEAVFTSSDEGSDEEAPGDEDNWDGIDSYVLQEPDRDYVPDGPRTEVRRRAKRKKTTKKRTTRTKKKTTRAKKKSPKKKATGPTQRKRRKTTKRKSVTPGQRRLASAIGIIPETGKKRDRYPADGIRRGKSGAPRLSLFGERDELPIPDPEEPTLPGLVATSSQATKNSNGDLIGSIMFEQTKALAPARYQRVGRDGTILETDRMAEHRKRIDEKIAGIQGLSNPKVMNAANTASKSDDQARLNNRKNRPSRWGSPAPSGDNSNSASNTASIPLPAGPPISMSLDFIPVPQPTIVRPPITSPLNLNNRPSALNTSPSTSFALNAFASPLPPFAVNANTLGAQQGIPQLGTVSVSQQPLLQLPSQLFPGLLMQPPLALGAVNDLLAAGLIGNPALAAPPISQAPPFVLGHVTNPSQDLTQHLANLASSLHPLGANVPRLAVSGVPPPPPAIATCKPEVDLSISKPLAEKIRQITESNELRPLAENNDNNEKKEEKNKKDQEEPKHTESGRKSASAEEEEEASDVDAKVTTSKGPMFNQARQMLSTSLKKIFKKRMISKDEYKMIMKKGVTALSQRTRLDQTKVDDYASKYVQCIIHRRKKKR